MAAPSKHKDKIFELRTKGYSYKQIKKETGASLGTISYHLGKGQKDKYHTRGRHTKAKRRTKVWAMKDKPCMDCGVKYPPYVMDFDHRDPSQKVGGINWLITNGTWEQVLAEIEKCDLVCSNCHRIRTWESGIWRYQ